MCKGNMNEQDNRQARVMEIFRESGALLEGHFRLTSGKHSAQYVQCAQVLQYPHFASELAKQIAENLADQNIETVIGPAMGGIIVAYEVARALGVRALFTERENGMMKLRRGFVIQPGERILVVEDVITTGGSVKEVIQEVREAGGIPVAAGVLVDRSGGTVDLGVPLTALLKLNIQTYDESDCPLCKTGIPAVKPGSRASK